MTNDDSFWLSGLINLPDDTWKVLCFTAVLFDYQPFNLLIHAAAPG